MLGAVRSATLQSSANAFFDGGVELNDLRPERDKLIVMGGLLGISEVEILKAINRFHAPGTVETGWSGQWIGPQRFS
jgi:hypothetical protein